MEAGNSPPVHCPVREPSEHAWQRRYRWIYATVVLGVCSLLGPSMVQLLRYECSAHLRAIRGSVGSEVFFNGTGLPRWNKRIVRAKLTRVGYELNDTFGFFALRVYLAGEDTGGGYFAEQRFLAPSELWRVEVR